MSLQPGSVISLRATTPVLGWEYLRHREGRAVISPITEASPMLDKQDATWVVRAGLADGSRVSFEAKNHPGGYLRHHYGAVYQQQNDGSEQFALDATFVAVPGRNGHGVSFSSVNYPDWFLRHYAGEIYIARKGGPDPWDSERSWTDDVSWFVVPAWAPS